MILSDSSCQLLIDRWCSGVGPFWYARLEKVGGVGTHLVLIGEHMGAPLLKFVDTAPAFGMLNRHPVTVQIKPVVVGSAVRPHFVELPGDRIGHRGRTFMHVRPGGKAIQSIRSEEHTSELQSRGHLV